MSYRLENGEVLSTGIKRITREQADRALYQLENPYEDDPETAIHDVRKHFKKIRAVLRLVRDEIGEEVYQRENTYFRDAGKQLAALRESAVAAQTLETVRNHFQNQLVVDTFDGVHNILASYYRDMQRRMLEEGNVLAAVAASVRVAQQRIETWPIEREDFGAVADGLKRVYKRGRKGLKAAYTNPTPETFHDWRKRVKYLWYHVRLLQNIWPQPMGEFSDATHTLSNVLGDAHDLTDLHDRLFAHPQIFSDKQDEQALIALVERRRSELQEAARPIGERIYAEKPNAFVRRLGTYWTVWQAEHHPTAVI